MRARLAFALSMAIPFDFYLFDEITAVGDAAFRQQCLDTLSARLGCSGAIIFARYGSDTRALHCGCGFGKRAPETVRRC